MYSKRIFSPKILLITRKRQGASWSRGWRDETSETKLRPGEKRGGEGHAGALGTRRNARRHHSPESSGSLCPHCAHLFSLIIITDTLLTLCSCPGDHPQSTRLCSCQAGGTQLVAALAGASVAPLTSQLAAVLTPHSSLTAPALSSRPPQQLFRERRDVRPGPLRPGPGRAGPSL